MSLVPREDNLNLGFVISKLQNDLNRFQEQVDSYTKNNEIDVSSLNNTIKETQQSLQLRAEEVLENINNRVYTLPLQDAQSEFYRTQPIVTHPNQALLYNIASCIDRDSKFNGNHEKFNSNIMPIIGISQNKNIPSYGKSPGQTLKEKYNQKIIQNPSNAKNRYVINQSYGIQLPLIHKNESKKGLNQNSLKKGTISQSLEALPHANRVDPHKVLPSKNDQDIETGILGLIESGLISYKPNLLVESPSIQPPPIQPPPLQPTSNKLSQKDGNCSVLLSYEKQSHNLYQGTKQSNIANPAKSLELVPSSGIKQKANRGTKKIIEKPVLKTLSLSANKTSKTTSNASIIDIEPHPPPSSPTANNTTGKFILSIIDGQIDDTSPIYKSFEQYYTFSWDSISHMLYPLEKLMKSYSIPVAFVNGEKLAHISIEYELESVPDKWVLLEALENANEVKISMIKPGQRYLASDGKIAAANKIIATWKMYKARLNYMTFLEKKWAAYKIALYWLASIHLNRIRNILKLSKAQELDNFKKRSKIMSDKWDLIKSRRRVIIHIPSFGYPSHRRSAIDHFNMKQNFQMARLCDIKDSNVDVIYVSPLQLSEELIQYYQKLLGLKSAIDTGNIENVGDLSNHYKIIVPESINSFPSHKLCLSTLLECSPQAMKRIRNLIKGRTAYIVTGSPCADDLRVADKLDVPILCSEPEISAEYSSKSGSKKLFVSCGVSVPPGESDIYSLPQLQESLTQLIVDNLKIQIWLLKINDHFDGNGIAFINVNECLASYQWALKECKRYGEKWSKKWAQEAVHNKLLDEILSTLYESIIPANSLLYPTVQDFLDDFFLHGGVIEASPSADKTSISVEMLIEPNGEISCVMTGDQVHAGSNYKSWGISVPQSSIEPTILNAACDKIARACKACKVVGYFCIDFVTFIHPNSMEQILWATDLKLAYSNNLALYSLLQFSTCGSLDTYSNKFEVSEKDKGNEEPSRFAVMSTNLYHSNLSSIHYSVFFLICKAHGIGYDLKEKSGTIFTLIDNNTRDHLGMITIGSTLQEALSKFARNMSVIHQEISAPNMQGQNNFNSATSDIENILKTADFNENEEVDNCTD